LKEFGVGLPAPPEPFGTARLIVAKHERAHEIDDRLTSVKRAN
jgi:hypothetical protein